MESNLKVLLVLLVVLCYSFSVANARRNKYKTVETSYGLIRGKQDVTLLENKPYYAFRGVPYAQPPLGNLRFRPPVSPTSWKGVRDAFENGNECIQIPQIFKLDPTSPYIIGDEDCLYLNVYTPDVTGNFPVMFWIHGGAFDEGTGNFYGPDFLINENVVLVTINYRLGPFGWLRLGTTTYNGNMAFKDQVKALKWVNENIGNFGGDKNSITVFGESAGGASTHFLTVSKASAYLFKRSIVMSGSILSAWFSSGKDNVNDMFEFAQKRDPTITTMDDLIDFLININATDFIESTVLTISSVIGPPRRILPNFEWGPDVKTPYYDNYFFTDSGEKLIKNKNYESTVDTMFGFTTKEMFLFYASDLHNTSNLEPLNEKFEVQLPLNRDADIDYNSKTYRRIAKEIHDFYFGVGVPVDGNTLLQYIDLVSDMWITYAVSLAARIHATVSSGNTFFYVFGVDDKLNIFKQLVNITLPGASHCDELCYLFSCDVPNLYDDITRRSVADRAIKNIAKSFANFAKYGNPSIDQEVQPITKRAINYYNMTNDGIEIGVNPIAENIELWDNIYSQYYRSFLKTNLLNG